MSKSVKTITAKPFNRIKESDKNKRKLDKTLDAKMNRERQLDSSYDLRRNLMMARLFPEFNK